MPPAFDTLKPMSFSGIQFPFKTYGVKGAIRKHVHEYPHSPGGALEKLGRSLYEISVSVDFVAGYSHPTYKQMLTDLGVLRGLFEDQVTETLVIPHIGPIKACAEEWSENVVNTNRNTVKADLKFIEDQSSAFLVLEAATVTTTTIANRYDDFVIAREKLKNPAQAAAIGALPFEEPSIFSQIDNAAIAVLGIKDQVDLFGALVVAKIDSFASLLRQADSQVSSMDEPPYWEIREALHALWDAAQQLGRDVQNKDEYLKKYTVPVRMSVGQIASAIYGDASRGTEIMQLNVLRDPLAVEAGTQINYYNG
jgi:prophage DNA circulation protein